MINKKITAVLAVIIALACRPKAVVAQGVVSPSPVIYQQEPLIKDIQSLRIQYRGELGEYRNAENAYLIAKDQYRKLNTLASLEDVVQKTQAVMMARNKVLHTYLRLLRLTLISQAGIDLNEKKRAEQDLLTAIGKIDAHQKLFQDALDKPQLEGIAVNYQSLFMDVENAAYRALSLISIGKLQTIQDKSIILKEDMKAKIATTGGDLQVAERRRAFDEIDRTLATLKSHFDLVREKYQESSSSGYKSVYNTLQKQLIEAHSLLTQVLSFLGEVLKI